jgi:periplasmic protein TonB
MKTEASSHPTTIPPTSQSTGLGRAGSRSWIFEEAEPESNFSLAWANSVCLVILIVAGVGLKIRPIRVPAISAAETLVPAVFQPPAQSANTLDTAAAKEASEPLQDEVASPPEVVTAVAADTAGIEFSIPVQGPAALVPAQLAAPAPATLNAVAAPVAAPKPKSTGTAQPEVFTGGGTGDFPHPSYPRQATEAGMQGRVLLLVQVDTSGAPARVEVRETSGYKLLDQHALKHVQKRWVWPAGPARLFLVPIQFTLQN